MLPDPCGVSAAVANALPALEHCDLVVAGDHGRGVGELSGRLLDDDLTSLGPRKPRAQLAAHTIKH